MALDRFKASDSDVYSVLPATLELAAFPPGKDGQANLTVVTERNEIGDEERVTFRLTTETARAVQAWLGEFIEENTPKFPTEVGSVIEGHWTDNYGGETQRYVLGNTGWANVNKSFYALGNPKDLDFTLERVLFDAGAAE